jgi:uncharacterized protein with HEPN domain
MTPRINALHVEDMITDGERAIRYLGGLSKDELLADTMRSDALIRAVEVMGEACKRLPAEVKSRFPEVPWRDIARARDKVIHHYDGVNWDIVWAIAAVKVPAILPALRRIRDTLIAEEPPPPEIPPDA